MQNKLCGRWIQG